VKFTIELEVDAVTRGRVAHKASPVSVALTEPERATFETEARRRGLGLSTTIRALAFERASQAREERQRERARRWQTARLRQLIERIERDGFEQATQQQIDAVFSQEGGRSRRTSAAAGR
jgi:hypothetical protein